MVAVPLVLGQAKIRPCDRGRRGTCSKSTWRALLSPDRRELYFTVASVAAVAVDVGVAACPAVGNAAGGAESVAVSATVGGMFFRGLKIGESNHVRVVTEGAAEIRCTGRCE